MIATQSEVKRGKKNKVETASPVRVKEEVVAQVKRIPSVKAFVKDRTRVLEIYATNPPFCYSIITQTPLTKQISYSAIQPSLLPGDDEALKAAHEHLKATLNTTLNAMKNREEAIEVLKKGIEDSARLNKLKLSETEREKLLYYLVRDYLDYYILDPLMKDAMIEDVSCNGPTIPLFIWHRKYESIPTNIIYGSDEELDSFIIRLAYKGKRMVSVANPLLDCSLPDGSRAQLTYGRYASKSGSTYTIRKFKTDPLTIIDLIKNHTISAEMAAMFWYLVENKISIFVCGGVASGKTTLLNGVASFISPDAKVITIEDTPEIQLFHENWIRSVTRPSTGSSAAIEIFDLLKAAMRQRPDYILVGEIRGAEAYTLFQAMSTGHLGLATLHAENADSALRRLETEPMNIPRMMIAGLNMIVIISRREINGKPQRRILAVTEVKGLSTKDEIVTDTLFSWDPKTDVWHMLSESYYLKKAALMKGISVEEALSDIKTRASILNLLVTQGMRSFKEVTQAIRDYSNPASKANKSGA